MIMPISTLSYSYSNPPSTTRAFFFLFNCCPPNHVSTLVLKPLGLTHPPKISNSFELRNDFLGLPRRNLGLSFSRKRGLTSKAESGEGDRESTRDKAEIDARGQSTMPERFRYLTKEAPDPPVRWPYFVAMAFLIYTWRTVLWELYNWKKAAVAITHFTGYLLKFGLAILFHFIGDPITALVRFIETTLYTLRAFYSGIVAYTPVPELMTIIILAAVVLSVAKAAVPDSVNSQPYLLTFSGITGFAVVRGFISEPFFYTMLLGAFGFARFYKKKDYVSASLPVAVVLAAVGMAWVRVLVMGLFLALAVVQFSKEEEKTLAETGAKMLADSEGTESGTVPIPLLFTALAVGVRVAAKWVGYRHLTWMVA